MNKLDVAQSHGQLKEKNKKRYVGEGGEQNLKTGRE